MILAWLILWLLAGVLQWGDLPAVAPWTPWFAGLVAAVAYDAVRRPAQTINVFKQPGSDE